ncbi:MAG: alkaline phosphatase D family protein [Bradymonadaceae bacterium]
MSSVSPILRRIGVDRSGEAYRVLAVFDTEGETMVRAARIAYATSDGVDAVEAETVEEAGGYTRALFRVSGLTPGTEVSYAIAGADSSEALPDPADLLENATYEIHTLPDGGPEQIAVASCNGIERVKDDEALHVWTDLAGQLDEESEVPDLLLLCGDQIYADSIRTDLNRGELESTLDAVTGAYRDRYVHIWARNAIQDVLSQMPTLMMWDDHDIYNGYGSHDCEKVGDEHQQLLFNGASTAFDEFQGAPNPDQLDPGTDERSYTFETDRVAVVVTDGRTERNYREGRVLGDAQLQNVLDKVKSIADQSNSPAHLFLVVGTPFFHVSRKVAQDLAGGTGALEQAGVRSDVRDAWVAQNNRDEFEELLNGLFERLESHDVPQLSVVSGDVHVSTAGYIRKEPTEQKFFQITSSPIGYHPPEGWKKAALESATELRDDLVEKYEIEGELKSFDRSTGELLSHRNYAIVDTRTPSEGVSSSNPTIPLRYRWEKHLGEARDNEMKELEVRLAPEQTWWDEVFG